MLSNNVDEFIASLHPEIPKAFVRRYIQNAGITYFLVNPSDEMREYYGIKSRTIRHIEDYNNGDGVIVLANVRIGRAILPHFPFTPVTYFRLFYGFL